MNQKLTKAERLHSKTLIDRLFNEGGSLFTYPFKVILLRIDEPGSFPVQILVSVSKRSFKNAVDRNKVKRLVREAYRTNKSVIIEHQESSGKTLLLGLIYVGKSILSFNEIERKIILILHRLNEQDE